MSTKKKPSKPVMKPQGRPLAPAVNLEKAPPSEAFKRGANMGLDFIEAFSPEEAADAIAGFHETVRSRLVITLQKGEQLCEAASAGLKSLMP